MKRPPLAARDRVADLLKSGAERRLIDLLAEAWTRGLADGAEGAAALAASPASLSGGEAEDTFRYRVSNLIAEMQMGDASEYETLDAICSLVFPSPEAPATHRNIHGEPIVDVPLTPYADPEAPANRQEAGEVEVSAEDNARADAWADFRDQHLEDGNDGYIAAAMYERARVAFDEGWAGGRDPAFSHAFAALTSPKDVKGGGQ